LPNARENSRKPVSQSSDYGNRRSVLSYNKYYSCKRQVTTTSPIYTLNIYFHNNKLWNANDTKMSFTYILNDAYHCYFFKRRDLIIDTNLSWRDLQTCYNCLVYNFFSVKLYRERVSRISQCVYQMLWKKILKKIKILNKGLEQKNKCKNDWL